MDSSKKLSYVLDKSDVIEQERDIHIFICKLPCKQSGCKYNNCV